MRRGFRGVKTLAEVRWRVFCDRLSAHEIINACFATVFPVTKRWNALIATTRAPLKDRAPFCGKIPRA
jgi:hypothetical protein